jgi:hypothetical protein
MLKTVSSIVNAIGALNYKGTWDANANSPALTSSVGTKGDYYVVGTAGSTTLNGISNWGVGDWAAFNGSVWQRVEGGANLNGVDLSVSGTSTLSGLTASTGLALNASKEIVSVPNPTFNAYVGTSQAISAATFTVCNVNTEVFDTNSCFDTGTYRFTPTVAGYYQVNAQACFQTAATLLIASIFKSGNRGVVEGLVWTTLGLTVVSCAGIVYMNGSTDYLDLRVYSDSVPNTIVDGKNNTAFSATLVRPA